jgi:hypothetical protein
MQKMNLELVIAPSLFHEYAWVLLLPTCLFLKAHMTACTMPFCIPENQNQDYVNEAH